MADERFNLAEQEACLASLLVEPVGIMLSSTTSEKDKDLALWQLFNIERQSGEEHGNYISQLIGIINGTNVSTTTSEEQKEQHETEQAVRNAGIIDDASVALLALYARNNYTAELITFSREMAEREWEEIVDSPSPQRNKRELDRLLKPFIGKDHREITLEDVLRAVVHGDLMHPFTHGVWATYELNKLQYEQGLSRRPQRSTTQD